MYTYIGVVMDVFPRRLWWMAMCQRVKIFNGMRRVLLSIYLKLVFMYGGEI